MKPIQHALQMPAIGLSAGGAGRSNWYKGNTHTHTFWSDGKEFPETAAVMWWRGKAGQIRGLEIAKKAALDGHDLVVAANGSLYFDYCQSRDKPNQPLAIGGFLPLEQVYAFEPVIEGFGEVTASHILGAQGQVWTECIPNMDRVHDVSPRLCAGGAGAASGGSERLQWFPPANEHTDAAV